MGCATSLSPSIIKPAATPHACPGGLAVLEKLFNALAAVHRTHDAPHCGINKNRLRDTCLEIGRCRHIFRKSRCAVTGIETAV